MHSSVGCHATISDRAAALIEQRWAFAFEALGYERRFIDLRAGETIELVG